MTELEQLKAIRDNAPEGGYKAVHVLKDGRPFIWTDKPYRSLSDINRQIELIEENESLRKQLATAKADGVREAANATKWYHEILCGYHSLLEYADKLERDE